MFEKYLREAAIFPIYDAGNFGMQRRRVHGVLTSPDFNPRALMDDEYVEFTEAMGKHRHHPLEVGGGPDRRPVSGRHPSGSVIGLSPGLRVRRGLVIRPRILPVRCPLSGPFATATAVQPDGAGQWSAAIQPGWDIAGNANGGYLLAVATRALAAATGRPDPVTVTAHYMSPGQPGSIRIITQVLKEGKRFATGTATMFSGSRALLAVLGTLGDLSQAQGPELIEGSPPELPPPEQCVRLQPTDTFPPPFMGRVDLRLHPDDAAFATGHRSGRPLMRGWFRLPGGERVDSLALLCAVDAFPPTAFNARLPVAWTPTVELTAHIRASPAPGWLRCRFSTRFVTAGFLEEDGEVWDSTGRLVGQSRQLALVPRS